MRRPLSSTRVEAVPRPRSEMPEAPEAKPPPKVIGTEPELSTASVCSSSATVVLPERSMSARFTVCTEEAVSAWARRMFEPVISTRATGFGAASCAVAPCGTANRVKLTDARPTAPPPAKMRRKARESRVSVMSGLQWLGFPAADRPACRVQSFLKTIALRYRKQDAELSGLGGTFAPINERRLISVKVLGKAAYACVVRATSRQIRPGQVAARRQNELSGQATKSLPIFMQCCYSQPDMAKPGLSDTTCVAPFSLPATFTLAIPAPWRWSSGRFTR